MSILVGSDPEVFVRDHGKIVSAIGRVPGSKDRPHQTRNGFVQPDNVLAEFNINPAGTKQGFVKNLNAVLADLREFVPEISIQASHVYSLDELKAFGEAAFVFGCDPDFDAYNGGNANAKPEAVNLGLRTAGGHIHLGYLDAGQDEDMNWKCRRTICCDVVLGLPSVILDKDTVRKELYGKAGAFRPKVYGLEYRTLSNFWLQSEELMQWAFDGAQESVARFMELAPLLDDQALQHLVRDAINNSDKKLARSLCRDFKVIIP